MSQENRAVLDRINEEAFNQGRTDVIDELVAGDFVEHNPMPGVSPDREGFKQLIETLHRAFPDMHVEVQDQIADGDKVAERWVSRGTHEGEFMGAAPTHNEVVIEGMDISRIENGKLVEHWTQMDAVKMMQGLGLMPEEATA